MWTTGFWNAVQHAIPVGGTVCPVIIASDKTNLTRFSGNKLDLKLRTYEIFHRSMAHVLEPLKSAGNPKTGGEMVGGDGNVRKVYPLLCTYVADYPEQCLVTCTKYGTCPKCQRKANDLGLASAGDSRTVLWTLGIMKEAHDTSVANQKATPGQDSNSTRKSKSRAHTLAMKHDVAGGIEPFWKDFPLTDIHDCITPDILHQCYQGVFKHLLKWVQEIVVLPPTCGVRHFKKGIADFSQVTGTEHKHIARILLASLTGKVDQRGIVACKALLNFIHLAQTKCLAQKKAYFVNNRLPKIKSTFPNSILCFIM
ncbi:hypothetical protein BDP27DRAFT_1382874 [Rhodocollybia butyracea]|uniref:Uncharacterized protein n=1 Tax=Rhodocollybia butyracea TaxID=206335 RepID=A0A9P5PVZ1_9AGAR|nr:hypothetical protein BDP27DRAFT_1382874 [Rhodocollybia butyracea]